LNSPIQTDEITSGFTKLIYANGRLEPSRVLHGFSANAFERVLDVK